MRKLITILLVLIGANCFAQHQQWWASLSQKKFVGLLDTINVRAAFSTRLLRSDFKAPLMTVKKTGTNLADTFAVMPLANGKPDVSALSTWAGSDSIHCLYWYNQATGGRIVTNETFITLQVRIVGDDLEVIKVYGNRDFSVFASRLDSVITAAEYYTSAVVRIDSVNLNTANSYNNAAIWGDFSGFASNYIRSVGRVGIYNWDGNEDTASTTHTIKQYNIYQTTHNSGSIKIRVNGNSYSTASSGNTQTMSGSVSLGTQFGSRFLIVRFREFIISRNMGEANLDLIRTNQNAYYGVY